MSPRRPPSPPPRAPHQPPRRPNKRTIREGLRLDPPPPISWFDPQRPPFAGGPRQSNEDEGGDLGPGRPSGGPGARAAGVGAGPGGGWRAAVPRRSQRPRRPRHQRRQVEQGIGPPRRDQSRG